MDELQTSFEAIGALPPDLHLCCPKVSEDDTADYEDLTTASDDVSVSEKQQRISDGKTRLDQLYGCSLVFGLPEEESWRPHKQLFLEKSNHWLRSCPECIRNWHKGRKPFLKRLSEFYSDDVVEEMGTRLNAVDSERITEGLKEAETFIREHTKGDESATVDQKTFIKNEKSDLLLVLYESLCCMAYLSIPENRREFNFVFWKIQQKRPLKLPDVVPTMTHFLFDEDPTRHKFATTAWEKQTHLSSDDFDWAVADSLRDALLKVNDPNLASIPASRIQRFWKGFLYILNTLDEGLILHSLCAMDVSPTIYETLLLHMTRAEDQILALVLTAFQALISKSPKAFWEAYSQYPHNAVAETVFRSPAFRPLLKMSGELEMMDGGSGATSWVKPFVDSIPTNQKSDVCDALLHHLKDFASDPSMPTPGQSACHLAIFQALSSTLSAFTHPEYKLRAHSSTIYTNKMLGLTLTYKDLIVQAAASHGRQNTPSSQASLDVVASALALDAHITSAEYSALQLDDNAVQREVTRDSSELWNGFLELLNPNALELAKRALSATQPLLSVEIFRPLKREKISGVKNQFNVDFQKTCSAIGAWIERLADFSPDSLEQLFLDANTVRPIVAALLHGEEAINQAAVGFIKSYTDEVRRGDAVQKILEKQFVPVLTSFTKAVVEINDKRTLWSPQFNILKYSREVLESLCDTSSGILRARTLTPGQRQMLGKWWTSQWAFLDNAFKEMDAWSHMIETEKMKEFCREAMELADALLEQLGLLASALSDKSTGEAALDESSSSAEAMKGILEDPRLYCYGLCRMLRLKDMYLVKVIVSVLGKLLKRLMEHHIDVPHQPLQFIKSACIKNAQTGKYGVQSNLTDQQRAELMKALGEDTEDDIQIINIKKADGPKKQTRLDAWSRTGDGKVDLLPIAAPREKLAPRAPGKSGKNDISELLRNSSSDKSRATLDRMKARQPPPKANPAIQAANLQRIKDQRAREQEEKKKRNAEFIAKAKALRAPKPLNAGEGSGLQGLAGVQGKDHAPPKSEMMVNSSSEGEESDEDDAAYEARTGTSSNKSDGTKGIRSMKNLPRGPVKKTKVQRSAKDMRARLVPKMDILHQAILEWDIFHEGNDPPNGFECEHVYETYGNPLEYKQTFLPLLIYEAWRSFVTSKDETTAKPFDVKVVNRMSVDKFIEVSTTMSMAQKKDLFLSEGDIVLLSQAAKPLETPDEPHCLARIWRTQFKNGSFEVSYRISSKAGVIVSSLVPQAELYAVRITNMITIEREYAALESLQFYDLMSEVLEAAPSPMLSFTQEAIDNLMTNYRLNTGQAKAVMHAKENDGFTLVQGPPGTGKTKTIVAMVGALLTGTFGAKNAVALKPSAGAKPPTSSKKLLVCAPSNAAVDELVLRLKAGVKTTSGSFHKINVLRLGRSEAVNSAVKDVTLDELVKTRVEGANKENSGPSSRELMHQEAGQIKSQLAELRPQLEAMRATDDRAGTNQLQRKFDELKRRQMQIGAKIDADKDSGVTAAREGDIRRRQIQQEILNSAQVLCATLSGSGHEMFKNLDVEFETVIIDEAAQCVELSALIPLKYGCSKCILVGDPKQLPPTVLSQSAAKYGYDQSLFVRMQRNRPDDVHLLDTQYRMHPEISFFPSQEFYEKRLLDGAGLARDRRREWHQSELLGPYRFFDVKGSQERGRKGQSLVNIEELNVAMQLYERFRTDYPNSHDKGKIGIITPYKAQLFELRERFSRRYGEGIQDIIDFNTTDAFQGRECEIIIFSCVRASPTGGIGFMTDIRRMNVGLTRAKASLWILGDSRALVQGEFWNKLIVDSKSRNRYTSGDIQSMLRRPGVKVPLPALDEPDDNDSYSPPAAMSLDSPVVASDTDSVKMLSPAPGAADKEVVMEEVALPQPPPEMPEKYKTPQLPQTYDLVERQQVPLKQDGTLYGGVNERGEPIAVNQPAGERPVIHTAVKKRPRESSESGQPIKRVAQAATGLLPGKSRPPPSAPRNMPRPQDPSAHSNISNNASASGPSRSTSGQQQQQQQQPPANAPKGPSRGPPRPPRPQPMVPPKKKGSDPFIKRKR